MVCGLEINSICDRLRTRRNGYSLSKRTSRRGERSDDYFRNRGEQVLFKALKLRAFSGRLSVLAFGNRRKSNQLLLENEEHHQKPIFEPENRFAGASDLLIDASVDAARSVCLFVNASSERGAVPLPIVKRGCLFEQWREHRN